MVAPIYYRDSRRVKRPLREPIAANRRERSYVSSASTADTSAAMNAMTLSVLKADAANDNAPGEIKPVFVRVAVTVVVMGTVVVSVPVVAMVGATVGARVGATVGAMTVAVGAIGGAPASGGMVNVLPTFNLELVVRLFASRMSLYLVPSLYIFCAIIHGLSPDTIVYVRLPGFGAAGFAGAGVLAAVGFAAGVFVGAAGSGGKVGIKIGVGKTYGALVGSSPCA